MTDDDDGSRRVQPLEGVDDVQHHRSTADAVERLGAFGPHAGTGAGGQEDR